MLQAVAHYSENHGSRNVRNGSRKLGPVTRNVVSIRRPKYPRNGVLACSYYSFLNRSGVFYLRIKSRDESHAPTVATSSVENGGQPQGDAPEKEI